MKIQPFLFLFFIICSSLTFAIPQSDIDTINRINSKYDVLIDDNTILKDNIVIDDNKIFTPASSQNYEVLLEEKVSGIVYSDNADIEVIDANIDLNNVGVDKGLIAIAGNNISGDFLIHFYTNMPNTPFSIKHYDGITDDKNLVQKEGNIIIPLIYSDSLGTVSYRSNDFSTQILSFPDPLVHGEGGQTTTYYLDYFFSSYDFVSFNETGVFLINDSWSNYSDYESQSPTDGFVSYSDSNIETYFQGASKRVRLISKNVTDGFYKTVRMCAYNNIALGGAVCQNFNWDLNASSYVVNMFPVQKGFIPNQTIAKNSRKIISFNDYYTNYTDIILGVFNASNLSQFGNGFNQPITVNYTLYQYANISNSTVFLVDLNGIGTDVLTAIYSNNTDNIVLEIDYTAMKKNSSGDYNSLNSSTFYLTINGTSPVSEPNSLLTKLSAYWNCDYGYCGNNRMNGTNFTSQGSAQNTSLGKLGNGFKLIGATGDSNYWQGTNINELTNGTNQDYTLCFWVNFSHTYQNSAPLVLGSDSASRENLFMSSGGRYSVNNYGSELVFNATIQNNTWYHTCLVVDGVTNKEIGYIDGKNVVNTSVALNIGSKNINLGRALSTGFNMSGVIDEIGYWNRTLNYSEIATLWNNGTGCSFDSCINTFSYIKPTQNTNLSNISIDLDSLIYLDYNDYFSGFDRVYINFTSKNNTNITLYSLLNATSQKYTDSYYTLNLSGNSYTERLYVTAGLNISYTVFNISICNHDACIYVLQSLNISEPIITNPPVQTYHIDNIYIGRNATHTENWGAYFANYTSLIINFIDIFTSNNITLICTNNTVNYTTSYMNITSFVNGIHVNTTFQSFNTSYNTTMLISVVNAYGEASQYINFNINYSYDPPVPGVQPQCENASTLCLLPDYTTLTQTQRNTYVLLGLFITMCLLGILFYKMYEIGIAYSLTLFVVFIWELIYFAKIKYLSISQIVGITFLLILALFGLYKWVTK
jgi:hypothetical protein